ncbi:germinal-center associated nuclear protein-like [Pomacea canaliculata]|uniref:germinal-center associated nuclear protein-like n=1 Tax=Pomacea canaliculata TaxID=400727 RepID=UPI000D73F812|nr:germinal-center associated nuclear protein-like [Pomacea canaliculata]
MEGSNGSGFGQQSPSAFSSSQGFSLNTSNTANNTVYSDLLRSSGQSVFGSPAVPSFSSVPGSATSGPLGEVGVARNVSSERNLGSMQTGMSVFRTSDSQMISSYSQNTFPVPFSAGESSPLMSENLYQSTGPLGVTGFASGSTNTMFGFGQSVGGVGLGSGFGSNTNTGLSNTGFNFGPSGTGFGSGVSSGGSEFKTTPTGFGSETNIGGSGFGFGGTGFRGTDNGAASSGLRLGSNSMEVTTGSDQGASQSLSKGFGPGSSSNVFSVQSGGPESAFGTNSLTSITGQGSGSASLSGSGGFSSNPSFGGSRSVGFGGFSFNTSEKLDFSTPTTTAIPVVTTGFTSRNSLPDFGAKSSSSIFGGAIGNVNKSEVSVFGGAKSSLGSESAVLNKWNTASNTDKGSFPGSKLHEGHSSMQGFRATTGTLQTNSDKESLEQKPPFGMALYRHTDKDDSRTAQIRHPNRKFTFSLNSAPGSAASHSSGPEFSRLSGTTESTVQAAALSGHKRTADQDDGTETKRGRSSQPETRDIQQAGSSTGLQSSDSGTCTPEKRNIRRSSSLLENVKNKTSIVCKRVPAKYNKHSFLQSHFSKFGKITKIHLTPNKMAATIDFTSHEDAANAKAHGAVISPHEPPLSIFWRSSSSDKSTVSQQESKLRHGTHKVSSKPSSSSTRAGLPEDSRQTLLQKRSMTLSKSVAEELAIMGGTAGSVDDVDYQVLSRPREKKHSVQAAEGSSAGGPSRYSPPPQPALSPSKATSVPVKQAKLESVYNIEAALSSLRRASATTTAEKISILDTRDKLLRQARTKKQSSSIHSQAFVGTCPDMCPEKERLYREDGRLLSIYEIIPGSSILTGSTSQVDHSKAVKEYSRSSADQEEPLPHELRPLPVLVRTMTYLLKEIAKTGEDGKWAEWYDFLWNRTRGIRKDITQQQLCTIEVAGLIEKCARFHIYCSERLCEEDMMVFDPKINNENLTKCLQTLREIYADLENKHNVFCSSEPEFRAYMVLMKLNEGDTLRQIQQLRPSVRNSPEIEFAVKAYSALNSNNYVRFFRLVKSASFLNACILHRYFNQVRARALQIILTAHSIGPRQRVPFPVSELKRLLAFENEEQTREFCANYGLTTDGSDMMMLDRVAYVEPESSIPAWRAKELVESKLHVSVGEVINGEQLPSVLHMPPPHSSFNSQGQFIGSLEDILEVQTQNKIAASQQQLEPYLPPKVSQTPSSEAVAENRVVISNEAVKGVARDLFWEVIDQMAHEVSRSFCEARHYLLSFDVSLTDDILKEVLREMSREVCDGVLQAEHSQQQQRAAAEDRDRREQAVDEIANSLITSTVQEEMALIADTHLREARERDRIERENRCVDVTMTELLTEVTDELTSEVVNTIYSVDVVQRLQLLSDLQKAMELKTMARFLSLWRRRQKHSMLEFPSAPSMIPPDRMLQNLMPDRPDHISPFLPHKASFLVNRRACLTLLSPLESERQSLTLTAHLSLASLLRNLQRTRAWQPLQLSSLLKKPLTSCVQQWHREDFRVRQHNGVMYRGIMYAREHIYWKLLLLLPEKVALRWEREGDPHKEWLKDVSRTLSQWLCAKFSYGGGQQDLEKGILSLYRVPLPTSDDKNMPPQSVSVCVRTTLPDPGDDSTQTAACDLKSLAKGSSAIMFLLPHQDTTDDTVWKASGQQLDKVLKAKPKVPAVPLLLLMPCTTDTSVGITTAAAEVVLARLGLGNLMQQGLVSQVAVAALPVKPGHPVSEAVTLPVLHSQLMEAVQWMAAQAPEPPCLQSCSLGQLVEDLLAEHFFTPVLQDLHIRRLHGKLHQSPNTLISLYNSVLDHMALAVTSPSLQAISWPAPEFVSDRTPCEGLPYNNWNSRSHLADIYQLITNLRLPWFHYEDRSATDWIHVCRDVWTFVSGICSSTSPSAPLTARVSRLLAHTCMDFDNLCSLTNTEDYCTPTYVSAPWTDIVMACVNFRLETLCWKQEDDTSSSDVRVFYEEQEMTEFEPPGTWVQALLDTETTDVSAFSDSDEEVMSDDDANTSFNNNCLIEDRADDDREQVKEDRWILHDNLQVECGHHTDLSEVFDLSHRLASQMEEEKRRSHQFEEFLKNTLTGPADMSTRWSRHLTPAYSTSTRLHCRSPQVNAWSPASSNSRHLAINTSHIFARDTVQTPSAAALGLVSSTVQAGEAAVLQDELTSSLPLEQSIESLRESIASQRQASELYEKRLQMILDT